jgi:hypothetical protein
MKRYERRQQLLEPSDLIVKSELADLTEDDRAVIFRSLLATTAMVRREERQKSVQLSRRRGKRGFEQPAWGDK